MRCEHSDFDEYFGKCPCGASRQQVIFENIKNELQVVYGKQLEALGIESGDIAPETAIELEEAEDRLATIASNWIDNRYEED